MAAGIYKKKKRETSIKRFFNKKSIKKFRSYTSKLTRYPSSAEEAGRYLQKRKKETLIKRFVKKYKKKRFRSVYTSKFRPRSTKPKNLKKRKKKV